MVSTHVVMLIQQIMGQRDDLPGLEQSELQMVIPDFNFTLRTDVQEKPVATQAPTTRPTTTPTPVSGEAASMDAFFGSRRLLDMVKSSELMMHVSAVFMEIGYSIQLLVKLSNQITKQCIKGPALEALEAAAKHARDVKYVGGHFLAHGADVVKELADSVIAYKEQDYARFGKDIGSSLRRIFLSKEDASLPSGKPGKYMMVNMSMGFVKGFFGRGFTLGIRLEQDPDEPLRVDLEECIANNLPLFEELGSTLVYALAQKQIQAEVDRNDPKAVAEAKQKKRDTRAQVGTALAVAMLQMPDALGRCGLGADQADMLIDSIKAFGDGMQLTLSTPNKLGSREDIANDLGKTIKDWSNLDWYSFGFDLGHLLQNLVLSLFQKKYAVSSDDVLRRQLTALDSPAFVEGVLGNGHEVSLGHALLAFAAFTAVAVTVLLVVRARRRQGHAKLHMHELLDARHLASEEHAEEGHASEFGIE